MGEPKGGGKAEWIIQGYDRRHVGRCPPRADADADSFNVANRADRRRRNTQWRTAAVGADLLAHVARQARLALGSPDGPTGRPILSRARGVTTLKWACSADRPVARRGVKEKWKLRQKAEQARGSDPKSLAVCMRAAHSHAHGYRYSVRYRTVLHRLLYTARRWPSQHPHRPNGPGKQGGHRKRRRAEFSTLRYSCELRRPRKPRNCGQLRLDLGHERVGARRARVSKRTRGVSKPYGTLGSRRQR